MLKSIDINDLASIGVIQDEPAYQLPPEAWSLGNNMRILDGGMRRLFGWTQIFTGTANDLLLRNGTDNLLRRDASSLIWLRLGGGSSAELPVGPYFIQYVTSGAQPWWLWASLTDIYAYDGVSHVNISKSNAAYGATSAAAWNGTILGGIPILNEGTVKPQYWNLYAVTTKMADLTNFPVATLCRVIRAFGPFLMALNITQSGTNLPHRVLWSTEASPGSLPASWDVADATVDAGRNDLPDVDSGIILDGLGLQGAFYIYKEASVWRTRFIGGRFIFQFESFLDTSGLLATRCVCLTGDGQNHVFVSQDDMVLHNGNTATPLLDKKFKRYLFNQIDTTNYGLCYMFSNPLYDEVWFCYPSVGATSCNRALIYNWKHGKFTEADIDFQCAAVGTTQTATAGAWSAAPYTWVTDPNPWSTSMRRRTVIGNPANKKIHLMDNGTTRDGVAFTGTLQRTGLSIVGRKRTGEWIEDFQQRKIVNRVWPKVVGGPINIRVGYQAVPNGAVSWKNAQSFDPASAVFVDGFLGSGRAVAIEFAAATDWRIDGYQLTLAMAGKY